MKRILLPLIVMSACGTAEYRHKQAQSVPSTRSVDVPSIGGEVPSRSISSEELPRELVKLVETFQNDMRRYYVEVDTSQIEFHFMDAINILGGETELGYTFYNPVKEIHEVYLVRNFSKRLVYHELGHVFGLEHTNNESDIMYTYVNYPYVSEEQIEKEANDIRVIQGTNL